MAALPRALAHLILVPSIPTIKEGEDSLGLVVVVVVVVIVVEAMMEEEVTNIPMLPSELATKCHHSQRIQLIFHQPLFLG